MDDKKTLLTFPCHFPIKIMGKKTPNFIIDIIEITRTHFPETADEHIQHKESREGNYVAITVTVYAHNQETLDALYRALTTHPDIRMVL